MTQSMIKKQSPTFWRNLNACAKLMASVFMGRKGIFFDFRKISSFQKLHRYLCRKQSQKTRKSDIIWFVSDNLYVFSQRWSMIWSRNHRTWLKGTLMPVQNSWGVFSWVETIFFAFKTKILFMCRHEGNIRCWHVTSKILLSNWNFGFKTEFSVSKQNLCFQNTNLSFKTDFRFQNGK